MVRSGHLRLSLGMEPPILASLSSSSSYLMPSRNNNNYLLSSWEAGVDGVAQTWIPDKVVYRVSIFLMAVERLQIWLVDQFGNNINGAAASAFTIDAHWLVPITTSVASFCFFLSLMVQLQAASDDDSALLAGMLSLAVVEMLVPVVMIGGTILCCVDVLTGETAALLIAIVWVASSLGSDSIRHYLYPNLGHG